MIRLGRGREASFKVDHDVIDQAGLSAADLKPYIGGLNRVYEVLNGKRGLSLAMIRKLHAGLGVPLSSLIGTRLEDFRPSS